MAQSKKSEDSLRLGRGSKKIDTPWTRWIRTVRALTGYDQTGFAPYTGKSRSTLAMYETGKLPIPAEVVAAIRTAFVDAPPPPRAAGDVEPLGQVGTEQLFGLIPYAGVVPASSGWGDPLGMNELRQVNPKFARPGNYMVKVKGESCWPALRQGDLAIFRSETAPPEGVIILAETLAERACTVKQLKRDSGVNRLVPVNTEFTEPFDSEGWSATAVLVGVIDNSHTLPVEIGDGITPIRARDLIEIRGEK